MLQGRPHLESQTNFSKVMKIEIISNISSNHNTVRLDINYKKRTIGNTNTWRLNNTFLNDQQVTEETKRKTKEWERLEISSRKLKIAR